MDPKGPVVHIVAALVEGGGDMKLAATVGPTGGKAPSPKRKTQSANIKSKVSTKLLEKGVPARTVVWIAPRSSRKSSRVTRSLRNCKSNKNMAKAAPKRQKQEGDGSKSRTKAKGKKKSPDGEGACIVILDPDSHAVEEKGWTRRFMFVYQATTGSHVK